MGTGGLKHVRTIQWTNQESAVESSGEPFMAPSRRVICMAIGCKFKGGRSITLDRPLQVSFRCKATNSLAKAKGKWKMEGQSPLSREGSKEGCNCSHCGGCSVGGLGKEVEEIIFPKDGGENPGERWFNEENSQAKRRSLLHLERELDASLLFEHGGGPREIQLCVTRILLGWLFREHLVHGQAVKIYSRFQRREIMQCMVKLNDSEELAEPLLGGTSGASTSGFSKDEAMDLDEGVRL